MGKGRHWTRAKRSGSARHSHHHPFLPGNRPRHRHGRPGLTRPVPAAAAPSHDLCRHRDFSRPCPGGILIFSSAVNRAENSGRRARPYLLRDAVSPAELLLARPPPHAPPFGSRRRCPRRKLCGFVWGLWALSGRVVGGIGAGETIRLLGGGAIPDGGMR